MRECVRIQRTISSYFQNWLSSSTEHVTVPTETPSLSIPVQNRSSIVMIWPFEANAKNWFNPDPWHPNSCDCCLSGVSVIIISRHFFTNTLRTYFWEGKHTYFTLLSSLRIRNILKQDSCPLKKPRNFHLAIQTNLS